MLELWQQRRPAVQEDLLAVRILLRKNYQPYADLLPPACQPAADWLHRELLPALALLPRALAGENEEAGRERARLLALALELSFLAGRVHDLTAQEAPQLSSRGILAGDYLYTLAAVRLAEGGYDKWLERLGRTLCRRCEGKLERLGWQARPFVPEGERLLNLHKENAEGAALGAELAMAGLSWGPAARQAWTEFGFYAGQAQAILLAEPQAQAALAEALRRGEQALAQEPLLLAAARELILIKLRQSAPGGLREDNEEAVNK